MTKHKRPVASDKTGGQSFSNFVDDTATPDSTTSSTTNADLPRGSTNIEDVLMTERNQIIPALSTPHSPTSSTTNALLQRGATFLEEALVTERNQIIHALQVPTALLSHASAKFESGNLSGVVPRINPYAATVEDAPDDDGGDTPIGGQSTQPSTSFNPEYDPQLTPPPHRLTRHSTPSTPKRLCDSPTNHPPGTNSPIKVIPSSSLSSPPPPSPSYASPRRSLVVKLPYGPAVGARLRALEATRTRLALSANSGSIASRRSRERLSLLTSQLPRPVEPLNALAARSSYLVSRRRCEGVGLLGQQVARAGEMPSRGGRLIVRPSRYGNLRTPVLRAADFSVSHRGSGERVSLPSSQLPRAAKIPRTTTIRPARTLTPYKILSFPIPPRVPLPPVTGRFEPGFVDCQRHLDALSAEREGTRLQAHGSRRPHRVTSGRLSCSVSISPERSVRNSQAVLRSNSESPVRRQLRRRAGDAGEGYAAPTINTLNRKISSPNLNSRSHSTREPLMPSTPRAQAGQGPGQASRHSRSSHRHHHCTFDGAADSPSPPPPPPPSRCGNGNRNGCAILTPPSAPVVDSHILRRRSRSPKRRPTPVATRSLLKRQPVLDAQRPRFEFGADGGMGMGMGSLEVEGEQEVQSLQPPQAKIERIRNETISLLACDGAGTSPMMVSCRKEALQLPDSPLRHTTPAPQPQQHRSLSPQSRSREVAQRLGSWRREVEARTGGKVRGKVREGPGSLLTSALVAVSVELSRDRDADNGRVDRAGRADGVEREDDRVEAGDADGIDERFGYTFPLRAVPLAMRRGPDGEPPLFPASMRGVVGEYLLRRQEAERRSAAFAPTLVGSVDAGDWEVDGRDGEEETFDKEDGAPRPFFATAGGHSALMEYLQRGREGRRGAVGGGDLGWGVGVGLPGGEGFGHADGGFGEGWGGEGWGRREQVDNGGWVGEVGGTGAGGAVDEGEDGGERSDSGEGGDEVVGGDGAGENEGGGGGGVDERRDAPVEGFEIESLEEFQTRFGAALLRYLLSLDEGLRRGVVRVLQRSLDATVATALESLGLTGARVLVRSRGRGEAPNGAGVDTRSLGGEGSRSGIESYQAVSAQSGEETTGSDGISTCPGDDPALVTLEEQEELEEQREIVEQGLFFDLELDSGAVAVAIAGPVMGRGAPPGPGRSVLTALLAAEVAEAEEFGDDETSSVHVEDGEGEG